MPRKLREITARLKANLTKIKKITQTEGRGREADSSSAARRAPAGGKEGKGAADGGAEEGGSWRDAGGILGEMKEGINVNLKDVKVPEFDVRFEIRFAPSFFFWMWGRGRISCGLGRRVEL